MFFVLYVFAHFGKTIIISSTLKQEEKNMTLIIGEHLALSYGAFDIFDDVNVQIPPRARIALVGPNGCGKSSLVRILAGEQEPTRGRVNRARTLRIGYLPQLPDLPPNETPLGYVRRAFAHLDEQTARLRHLEQALAECPDDDALLTTYAEVQAAFEAAGGYTYEARIRHMLLGVGVPETLFDTPLAHLSGGQQTRVALAHVLAAAPDVLFLDEPTNHLDVDGVEWLETFLTAYEGALVFVAHDRAFIDAVATTVWELSHGRLREYKGNYSAYVRQRAEALAREQAAYERQQAEIARTEAFIRRYIAGQKSKQARGRRKQLERMQRLDRPPTYRPPRLRLPPAERTGDMVLELNDVVAGYAPDAPLVRTGVQRITRGERVALVGPNGSGKTTLLRTILGEVPPLSGRIRLGSKVRIGYFAQTHAHLRPDETVLAHILHEGLTYEAARALLARYLFVGDAIEKRVSDLSGGERARLALALLEVQNTTLLLLDEPTNHLDIPSQEAFQAALEDFEGTILFVSHDRYLIEALADQVWAIADGQLWQFEDGWPAYRAWLREQARTAPTERDGAAEYEARKAARRAAERERRARQRLEEAQAAVEARMAALEEELAALSAALAAASEQGDAEAVARLGEEYASVQAALHAAEEEWLRLAEALEE